MKGQEGWAQDLSLPGAHTARLPFLLAPTQLRRAFGSHCGYKRCVNIDVAPDKSFLWQQHAQGAAEPNSVTRDTNLSIRGVPAPGTAHIPLVWPIKMFGQ